VIFQPASQFPVEKFYHEWQLKTPFRPIGVDISRGRGERFFLAVILTPLSGVKITAFFLFPALGRG